MLLSIMQPYFFPYIGYFQLMAACDSFVVFDDVQYIQRGWINRNRILVDGKPRWITLPVAAADHRLPINRRNYLLRDRLSRRVRRLIEGGYRNAPHVTATLSIVDRVLGYQNTNVAEFNTHLLRCVADYLGITTPISLASGARACNGMRGEERVMDICSRFGASGYLNPIGGNHLYSADCFARRGLTLQFLQSCASHYRQFSSPHVANLSIIDVMMFNDATTITRMLSEYALLQEPRNKSASANGD